MISINHAKCVRCAGCVSVCPVEALCMESQLKHDSRKCIDCSNCVNFCPVGALKLVKKEKDD